MTNNRDSGREAGTIADMDRTFKINQTIAAYVTVMPYSQIPETRFQIYKTTFINPHLFSD